MRIMFQHVLLLQMRIMFLPVLLYVKENTEYEDSDSTCFVVCVANTEYEDSDFICFVVCHNKKRIRRLKFYLFCCLLQQIQKMRIAFIHVFLCTKYDNCTYFYLFCCLLQQTQKMSMVFAKTSREPSTIPRVSTWLKLDLDIIALKSFSLKQVKYRNIKTLLLLSNNV